MKEWILVGTNNAGLKPREGGPISGSVWKSTKPDKESDSKQGVIAGGSSSVKELTEIAKFTAEEIHKL